MQTCRMRFLDQIPDLYKQVSILHKVLISGVQKQDGHGYFLLESIHIILVKIFQVMVGDILLIHPSSFLYVALQGIDGGV